MGIQSRITLDTAKKLIGDWAGRKLCAEGSVR